MTSAVPGMPRILLCADSDAAAGDVRRLLEQAGHEVRSHVVNGSDPHDAAAYHLVVLDGGRSPSTALRFCRRLRSCLSDGFVPILYLSADSSPMARLAGLEGGADTYLLRPFEPQELLAQVRAFLRIKQVHDRLAEKTNEVHLINKRLQQAYGQIDQELELASRIQKSFLPQTLPDLPGWSFAVHYLLCGRVGGDFYDVFRLDEQHVGLYVADAMGHGVPASLLAIFVKKGVRAKEIFGNQYRLLPPGEVLKRLNADLVEQALAEHPFITMAYALVNVSDGTFRFARAGHPYPLYIPREGEPQFWKLPGSLLGVFDTAFPDQAHELLPGDKVVLYSDGVDSGVFAERPPGADSLLECASLHRNLPVAELIPTLGRELFGRPSLSDDLTLLGVERSGG